MNYLLSICIPTYNRETCLKKLLDSIIFQDGFSDEISIVINDGPSKDGTQKMVSEYQEKYKNIFYSRNETAVGISPALLESIEMSNGEYTWLVWSDDIMTKYALQETLSVIKNQKPWIIFSDRIDFLQEEELEGLPLKTGTEDVILHGVTDFIDYLWNSPRKIWNANTHFFTFMSVFCFRQNLYTKNKAAFVNEYVKKQGYHLERNYFNYVLVLFSNIREEKIVIIKSTILILARLANTSWSFNGMEIFKDLSMTVRLFRKNYAVHFRCNLFLNYLLFIWLLPCLWGIVKKNPLLKHFHAPLSKIVIALFYKKK